MQQLRWATGRRQKYVVTSYWFFFATRFRMEVKSLLLHCEYTKDVPDTQGIRCKIHAKCPEINNLSHDS